ncbi:hypothetical protein FKG94_14295 [Exilibacterium tricleocarpae]|uniref:Uncharacterized protein n=1 Tax=Exilibacterium tricleocarpae TaxID=2591008 RepID=A0A545TLW1_9GAMM|nr:hypothetical protein [Exilibacterium tricleocarpae]TQV78235.1 hypothetical protein FKG94_14295 [Exilibacterium tricleocarpae]
MSDQGQRLHTIDMVRTGTGTYEPSGRIVDYSPENEAPEAPPCPEPGSGVTEGQAHLADQLRAANELYLAEMHKRFSQFRQETMDRMAAMTSIQNIRY